MTIAIFLFGLIVGSFLNVVGLRWNSGLGLGGRSFCPACGKRLKFSELIPVVSFLVLCGKCSSCKSRISPVYPLIEIFTGLVFVTIFNFQFSRLSQFGGQAIFNEFSPLFIIHYSLFIIIFSIYILILIYDFRHKIIPDELSYSAILLSLVYLLTNLPTYQLIDLLAGPIIFGFFALIWLITRGRAMGFGDAKLGLSIGLILGAAHGFSAIILSFWIGSVIAVLLLIVSRSGTLFKRAKKLTMKSEIPFAPFMIIGAWLGLIFELDLLHVSLF